MKSLVISFVLTLTYSQFVFGHNGSIAFAYPVKTISVDGELNDWPKSTTRYPIKLVYGNSAPKNEKDIKAFFRTAYNLDEQSLYFALEVYDDSHVRDTTANASWASHDNHILYIDFSHSQNGSGIKTYLFSQDLKTSFLPDLSWDPLVRNANWDNVKVTSKRVQNKTIYEWSIRLKGQIYPNRSIGIDHNIIDVDEGQAKNQLSFLAWGKGDPKFLEPGSLGDVILMPEDGVLSEIFGQIVAKNESLKEQIKFIRASSVEKPELWMDIPVDSLGYFKAKLPVGSYRIRASLPYLNSNGQSIRIDNEKFTVIKNRKRAKNKPFLIEIKEKTFPDFDNEEGALLSMNSGQIGKFDHVIADLMKHYRVPGLSLVLIKDNKIILNKAYGYRNNYTREPVTQETLFEAASITKPVFAFTVLRLAEKNLIDLDKPLWEYLPLPRLTDERYKLMTARHVLSHRSGFPNHGKRIIFTPGTEYGYSGEGFEYLQRVVEAVTGKKIEEVLQEELLQPLNMRKTFFSKNQLEAQQISFGHNNDNTLLSTLPEQPGMSYSMYTEPLAFSNFILALSNRKGLSSESYKQFFSLFTPVPAEKISGLGSKEYFGLGIYQWDSPVGRAFGHGGNNGDFQCQFDFYDNGKVGFAVFTNSNNGMKLINTLREYLITGKQK